MVKNILIIMVQAISLCYVGSPINYSLELPWTAENNPIPALSDTTGHTADQAGGQTAETTDSHNYNDPQTARKEALHPPTKTVFISVQLRYRPRKESTPYKNSHLKQMTNIQYSSMTLWFRYFLHFWCKWLPRKYTDYESDSTCSSHNASFIEFKIIIPQQTTVS